MYIIIKFVSITDILVIKQNLAYCIPVLELPLMLIVMQCLRYDYHKFIGFNNSIIEGKNLLCGMSQLT